MIFYLISVAGSLIGFVLSFAVRYRKYNRIDGEGKDLINDKYSYFLDMPLDVLGMLYYGGLAIAYTAILAMPSIATPFFFFLIISATAAALIFSLYLIFIQAFNLRRWCGLCILSFELCAFLFMVATSINPFGLIDVLVNHHAFIIALHLIGFAIGLGAATVTDVLFLKFLEDFEISEFENKVFHYLSQVIWFGLIILVLTGIGLYLSNSEVLNQTPKFLAKMIIVSVIILNGSILNLVVSPRLTTLAFHKAEFGKKHLMRKASFALGAVSITSWYSAFVLAMMPRSMPLGLGAIIGIYGALIVAALIASQIAERYLEKKTTLD